MFATERSLDVQREEFKRARLIAMPIAGLIVWLIMFGLLGSTALNMVVVPILYERFGRPNTTAVLSE